MDPRTFRARLANLVAALRVRGVIAVGGLYLVGVWLLVQAVSIVVPALHLADRWLTLSVVVSALGFPIALVIAWMYRWTPQGPARDAPAQGVHHPLAYALLTVALVGAASVAAWRITRDIAAERGYERARHAGELSIAVLPCENYAGDSVAYLATGLADEFTSRLSRLAAFKVVSGGASLGQARAKGEEPAALGMRYAVHDLLTCTLFPAAEGLRVSVRLIETATGEQAWSENFDSKQQDLLSITDMVAVATADHLLDTLLGPDKAQLVRHKTNSAEALDLYLKAHVLWQSFRAEDAEAAVTLLDRAIELDPGFAGAYVERDNALDPIAQFKTETVDWSSERYRSRIDDALAIDPNLAQALASKGRALIENYRIAEGRALVERAVALEPNSWSVLQYAANAWVSYGLAYGEQARGIELGERWRALRPDDPFAWINVGMAYYHQRQFERSLREMDAANARFPGNFVIEWLRAPALMALGRCDEARAALERATALEGEQLFAFKADAYACMGQREEALAILRAMSGGDPGWYEQAGPRHFMALLTLGDREAALRALERGLRDGAWVAQASMGVINADPLRDDPRWLALEKEFGISAVPRERWLPRERWPKAMSVDPKLTPKG